MKFEAIALSAALLMIPGTDATPTLGLAKSIFGGAGVSINANVNANVGYKAGCCVGYNTYYQPKPQVQPYYSGFSANLGLQARVSASAFFQTSLQSRAFSPYYGGFCRATNLNEADVQVAHLVLINEISALNTTLPSLSSEDQAKSVSDLSAKHDVTPEYLEKLAGGIVEAYKSNNVTSGAVFETFDIVSKVTLSSASSGNDTRQAADAGNAVPAADLKNGGAATVVCTSAAALALVAYLL
ncbi:hypothetical protein HDU81_006403 [Chytriomyces hyalinus]|nr:hypothetical protein HDU81_006403 [Chytriomyces hyalinus]